MEYRSAQVYDSIGHSWAPSSFMILSLVMSTRPPLSCYSGSNWGENLNRSLASDSGLGLPGGPGRPLGDGWGSSWRSCVSLEGNALLDINPIKRCLDGPRSQLESRKTFCHANDRAGLWVRQVVLAAGWRSGIRFQVAGYRLRWETVRKTSGKLIAEQEGASSKGYLLWWAPESVGLYQSYVEAWIDRMRLI